LSVAKSLLSRRQHHNPLKAVKLNKLMNNRIESAKHNMSNYLKLNYENLEEQIDELVNFLPFEINERQKESALQVIIRRGKSFSWNKKDTLKRNLWMFLVNSMLFLIKPFIKGKNIYEDF